MMPLCVGFTEAAAVLLSAAVLLLPLPAAAENNEINIQGLSESTLKNAQKPEQYLPRYNANPDFAESYYGGGVVIPTEFGKDKQAKCQTEAAKTDLYLRQECESINFIMAQEGKDPTATLSANEKLIENISAIGKQPGAALDKFQWKYPLNADGSVGNMAGTACPTTTLTVPQVDKAVSCNQYIGTESFLCRANLAVTVDPEYNYRCTRRQFQSFSYDCPQSLAVSCEPVVGCVFRADSVAADMNIRLTQHGVGDELTQQLLFGTIGDNYWTEYGPENGIYDRQMRFEVTDLSKLARFELERVEYDDYLVVEINDTVIYSTGGGLKWLTVVVDERGHRMVVEVDGNVLHETERINPDGSVYLGDLERGETWVSRLSMDLRPYLKTGVNQIKTRTIVGNKGEAALIFWIKESCPPKCKDTWTADTQRCNANKIGAKQRSQGG
ncbi:hypothetical protein [Stenoxybacter acetivorans]|uniref:hypothetical protein n=1 Tax=Stenoxybacter acetivorans TaxID=422441 RepID=UPI00068AB66F|nr:hypothetical protein [Stenoxybacter acetivorans]